MKNYNSKGIKLKTIITIAIALACVLCFCSCGKKGEQAKKEQNTLPETIYTAELFELPADFGDNSDYEYYNGKLYSLKNDYDEETDANTYSLISSNIDGSELSVLPIEVPDEVTPFGNIFFSADGKIYSTCQKYSDGENTAKHFLLRLNTENPEKVIVENLGELKIETSSDYLYYSKVIIDKDNTVFLPCDDGILRAFDINAKPLYEISVSNYIDSCGVSASGEVIVSYYGENGMKLSAVDTEGKKLGKEFKIPGNQSYSQDFIITGDEKYSFYINNGVSVWGYSEETEAFAEIFNWLDADMISDEVHRTVPLADGKFLCTGYNSSEDKNEFNIISPHKTSDKEKAKAIVNLAVNYADQNVTAAVVKFNKTNDKYRVRMTDYSQYNTEDDYEAGANRLNNDMISGNAPDIVDLNQLPASSYISKGLLADLYTFMDKDSEAGRDKFIESILKADETDGKLFSLAPSFAIISVIAKKSVVGDRKGWTLQEMQEALKALPEGTTALGNTTRETALYYMFYFESEKYIDWAKGTCDFDNDSFKNVLEFAKSFPELLDYGDNYADYVDDYELLLNNDTLAVPMYISNVSDIQFVMKAFDNDVNFIGYPRESGSGTVCAEQSKLAITKKSKNAEGAWEFLKFLVTSKPVHDYMFPICKEQLDAILAEAQVPETYTDEDGNVIETAKYSSGRGQNITVDIYAATDEEVAFIRDIIASIDTSFTYDMSIINIVTEETPAYFSGQKNADETAKIIQNRVGIYLSEIQ